MTYSDLEGRTEWNKVSVKILTIISIIVFEMDWGISRESELLRVPYSSE